MSHLLVSLPTHRAKPPSSCDFPQFLVAVVQQTLSAMSEVSRSSSTLRRATGTLSETTFPFSSSRYEVPGAENLPSSKAVALRRPTGGISEVASLKAADMWFPIRIYANVSVVCSSCNCYSPIFIRAIPSSTSTYQGILAPTLRCYADLVPLGML